jgi:hypothetical protein
MRSANKMKKVHSLKSMSQFSNRAWSLARSPVPAEFSRSKSTSSMPTLLEVDRVKNTQFESIVVQISETHTSISLHPKACIAVLTRYA